MSNPQDQSFAIRTFDGVDLTTGARINAPGSWKELVNLWIPQPDRLEQRPGTVEFASEVILGEAKQNWVDAADVFNRPPVPRSFDPTDAIYDNPMDDAGNWPDYTAPVGQIPTAGGPYVQAPLGTVLYKITF